MDAGIEKNTKKLRFIRFIKRIRTGKINVAHEQSLLESHDRIILQFPFYWYSTPSLLKQWQDEVLSYGWAYGEGGDKLHGKELGLAISTFGPEDSYQPTGYNHFTMETLTTPLQQTSNLIGTKFFYLCLC
ncbi:hypothetical protein GCM10020331_094910 [Ectobacillus funiculus]